MMTMVTELMYWELSAEAVRQERAKFKELRQNAGLFPLKCWIKKEMVARKTYCGLFNGF